MANGNRPLAADPYAHQPHGAWKLERQRDDRELLSQLLEMTEDQVYTASAQFVGREREFFRFLFAMRFLHRVNRFELTEDASILRVCSLIFAIEGIAPDGTVGERLSRFLVRYQDRNEKQTLFRGFTFTPEYPLGGEREADRHLMFARAVGDNEFRERNFHDGDPEYCSTGPHFLCFCIEWLQAQPDDTVDEFVAELGRKLYQMRCAVVHDGTPVVFGEAQENRPPDVAQWSVSLVDAFSTREGRYVTYESGILVPDLSAMVIRGLRRCFEDGARF